MDNIKISAAFRLKGSVMYQEKDQNGEPLHYDLNTMECYDKKTNQTTKVRYKTSRCKPCVQNIHMTEKAHQNMMGTPINGISFNHWMRMSENQRIAEHLKKIQYDLHATSFEFTVFHD